MTRACILVLFDRLRCKGFPLEVGICGGAQRKSFQLAQHFASRGGRVFFGSDDHPDSGVVRQLAANKITHVRVPFRSPGWLSGPVILAQLIALVRGEGVNVIHSHDRWTAMFGRCAALATRVDYFYTAHITFWNRRTTAAFFGNNVTAVSEAVKHNLITYFGMDEAHVQVIYNGEAIAPATPEECGAIRERYGLTDNHRVISSIGRLSPQKGHGYLLQALVRLTHDYPELKCLVVGDGDQRSRLERMTQDLGLGPHVVFCGAQDCVAPFIEVSEFTIFPSIAEGLPVGVIESLLLAVPVVAARVGGVPEIVIDGMNGLLVEPSDSGTLAEGIKWMLERPDQSRRMGLEGRESVRVNFSLEAMLSAYESYYASRLRGRHVQRAT